MNPFAALLLLAAAQEDPDRIHVPIHAKVAPATVYIGESERSPWQGSGVVIDPKGVILTSTTACAPSSVVVTVRSQGARVHKGRVMGRVDDLELVLVKIDAEGLPCVELGDSDEALPGDVAYVLGDSYHSILLDDQPAISMGVISGLYEVRKRRRGAFYAGKVLETSAAVNPFQNGGPLVDRRGRLLGMVTLNYDDSRFAGLAIPINTLKPSIEKIRREFEHPPAKPGRKRSY